MPKINIIEIQNIQLTIFIIKKNSPKKDKKGGKENFNIINTIKNREYKEFLWCQPEFRINLRVFKK